MEHAETIPVVVTAVEQVTPFIRRFTLAPVEGGELPSFSGGCHIVVVMRDAQRTHRNPYSLCSSPWDLSSYKIAVRRIEEGRGGSRYMHERVSVGTRLEIAHPVNLFPLVKLGRKHILIAGGVGITPILAMIADLRAGRVPWELHYRHRGQENATLGRLLRGQTGAADHGNVRLYDSAAGEPLEIERILDGQPLGTHVYTCGPAGMIAGVERVARAGGWPDSHIHAERFSAPPAGQPFEVRLARSNVTIRVPSERSLLEAIEAAGIDAPYLCRGGVCGQCETDVLELDGDLVHNDHWLSAEDRAANRKIMPCVSRATCRRLVLDR